MRPVLTVSILALAAVSGAVSLALAAAEGGSPAGVWMTEEGQSKIRVQSCGKAMCATILWVSKAGLDRNNPDPALRTRSIVGVDLTRDMRPDGKGGYSGSIYNPQDGKTYQATMQRLSASQLEVGGCVLGGLLCGSETWTRQPDTTGSTDPAGDKPRRR